MQLVPGQWIGGEFRVVRPLAAGGMGSVYVAEQRGTGKLRALKTLHAPIATDAAAVERFVREAHVGASIASEHVVEVIGAGVDAQTGIAFIAMELLEGETLEARVLARGPMPPGEVALVFRQLAHALSAAHRAGIVHRDLKPQNVVLVHARRGDSPFTVKILDFGIAKLIESATSAGNSQVIGSPPWMAPEQLDAGAPITPATDVWSLGLIAFFLLTSRVYWRGATASIPTLVAEIVLAPLAPASERARELGASPLPPYAFDAWFARAVARRPADRFASVDAMLAALETLVIVPASEPLALRSYPPVAGLAPTVAAGPPSALAPRGPASAHPGPTVAVMPPPHALSAAPAAPPSPSAMRWIAIVAVVGGLGVTVPGALGLVMRFASPWATQSGYAPLLASEPDRDPAAVAACRQARACCDAVLGPTDSRCTAVTESLAAATCLQFTHSYAMIRTTLPDACAGPPAHATARVPGPSAP
ncbi:MAG: serine/threonine protein kinase [Deltaproteobacteria bacterium]|nr:serine/threonine protein kinase [Deltaproteobacteria bacterium]